MVYFWPLLLIFVVLWIAYAIISSSLRERRIRKATLRMLPKVADHIQTNRRYNIFLSHGKVLQDVMFIGISRPYSQNEPTLPFPLCEWLILEKADGKRAYVMPRTVRYYEDA